MLKLNKEAYQELVDEDIAWLLKQPDTLERKHIECVLRDSVYRLYPDIPSTPWSAELQERIAKHEQRGIALLKTLERIRKPVEEHAPILIPLINDVSSMSLADMYEIEEDNGLHFNCHGEYTRDENRKNVIKEARAIAIEKAEKKSKSFWHNFYKG